MFYGEYQHSVDPKGRVIVPAKFREGLGEKFIVTKGLDNCLFAYSLAEWTNLEAKLKTLPMTNKDARAFIRFFFAGATECEVDKQGRILIPQNLREYAALEKDVYVIGVSTRVEIWDKAKWENYSGDDNINPDSIAEKMAELGI
ncbi:MAG: division/cell wall cluster transcriptional repressor MraZ [Clostridia bacterium]|nr:division/cell wall cluster transcriptional repressor MraZ [Clostridia bacterium]